MKSLLTTKAPRGENRMKHILSLLLAFLGFSHLSWSENELPLERLKLPKGFKIEVFVNDIENPRQMALSPSGVLFVGSREAGNVYAVKDKKIYTIAKDLNMP